MNDKRQEASSEIVPVARSTSHEIAKAIELIHSRSNTQSKLFERPITITLDDLKHLYSDIDEKLSQQGIPEYTFNAAVHFTENEVKEYPSGRDFFSNFPRHSEKRTELLILRWVIPTANAAREGLPPVQQMTVRMTESMHPMHLLQAIFSKDPKDLENFEIEQVPMTCRIDFAHHIFSDELMERVRKWNAARNAAVPSSSWYKFVQGKRRLLLNIVKYLPALTAVLASIVYFIGYNNRLPQQGVATVAYVYHVGLWFMISVLAIYLAAIAGRSLETRADSQFHISRHCSIFALTDGDNARQNEIAAQQKTSFSGALFKVGGSALGSALQPVIAIFLERFLNG